MIGLPHVRRGIVGFVLLAGWAVPAWSQTAPAPDYGRDVKPILSNTCFRCHGPDANERKGGSDGLRLDTADGATIDLGGYAAIVPGHPEQSELIKRATSEDPDLAMPPAGAGRKLTAAEIEILTRWIRAGARYTGHWSYLPPVRPPLPEVSDPGWVRNAVDRFILARLDREGLKPSAEADRATLIRRLSLDITGLPPAPADVDAFVADPDPQAYEKLVDRLLASEAYGEHWAHGWLDLARYADSAGYADDPPRTIWLYRDYVVRSFNQNKPFDQFTLEQIAGDLLPDPTPDQLIATAFHRNTLTNNEGGTNDEEYRNVAVVDRVNTTLAVWMGTTIACAQCHNHKYDPISQEEFFRVFAILNNSADADRGDESPLYETFTDEQQCERGVQLAELARLEQSLATPSDADQQAQQTWENEFSRPVDWQTQTPATVRLKSGDAATVAADGAIAAPGAASNVYTVEIPLANAYTLRGLRLEALTDDHLPGKGPGYANGNFVVSRVSATVAPPMGQTIRARYVRVELPGKARFLSLAEVQAFVGDRNVAVGGAAQQISTDFGGQAARAIDGKTDGNYHAAMSTSHTALADDPWWEVDLQADQPLDRIAVWNRTDGNVGGRLVNFRVQALDAERRVVWEQIVADAPNPSVELSLSGAREVRFATAQADYAQDGFPPQNALNTPAKPDTGWAIGGRTGQSHTLVLVPREPLSIAAGSVLTVTIEQTSSFEQHVLGRFRLSASDDPRAGAWGAVPAAVIAAISVPAAQRNAEQRKTVRDYYASVAPELKAVREQIAATRERINQVKPLTVPVMRELPPDQRRVTKIQHRGNFLDLGAEVTPGVPAALHPLPAGIPPDRLALAHWLIDDDNPLTPRVLANRYWEQLFGTGIVATSEEFGSQGDSPVHPELLDYLATEVRASQWDLKALIRLLVTSATYRQSSRVAPEMAERDPDNRLLARGPRFRLPAEVVRDQALAAAGLLSQRRYGPPVKPPQPSSGLSAAFGGATDWQTSEGEDRYRRALYTTWRRSSPYPSMSTFDAPNREVCTLRRSRTNTPLQALVTLNDPVYVEAAQALGRRMAAYAQPVGVSTADTAAGIKLGFRLCLSRQPQAAELARLVRLFDDEATYYATRVDDARKLATDPLGPVPEGADVARLAAWTVTANVLLNLDETLMKP